MTKKTMEDLIAEQVEMLDEQIAAVEKRMKPYEKLNETKQKLLAARKALLGQGSRLTGGTSTRLQFDELKGFFKENPGASAGQAAERFGVSISTITSAIYRNKDALIKKGGRFWVRDPKNGLNTADDIEEDD